MQLNRKGIKVKDQITVSGRLYDCAEGLIRGLEIQDDFEIIVDVDSGLRDLVLPETGLIPVIVLTDLNMPDMDGINFTRQSVVRPSKQESHHPDHVC